MSTSAFDLSAFTAHSPSERRRLLASTPRDALMSAFAAATPETLLDLMQRSVEQLGPYRAVLEKRERLGGKMSPPQTLQLTIREQPQAIRADFVAGPASGRKVIYDSTARRDEVHVREAGMLGFAGFVWLGLDNPLTRRDTHHPITHLGFAPLIALLRADFERATPFGGFARHDEGFDPGGRFRTHYTAPAGATGLYAKAARISVDPEWMLPTHVEVDDAQGPLEVMTYREIAPAPGAEFR